MTLKQLSMTESLGQKELRSMCKDRGIPIKRKNSDMVDAIKEYDEDKARKEQDKGVENSTNNEPIVIYTDGSCLGNPGQGGWGIIIQWKDGETQLWGNSPQSTNNEMELTAAFNACQELVKNKINNGIIYTDSQYVQKGITEWMKSWRKNGYMSSTKKPIKNQEIWKLLDEEQAKIDHIDWRWVKAHNGDPMNERVDQIARDAADKA